jgi:uncharacterized protein with HEPN domain
MPKPDDDLRLGHMLEAAQKALHFSRGKSRADLDQDELLRLALARLLEIVGEAASRVSPESRDSFPGIPWPRIVGMRNRLIHGYDQIDLEVLWQTLVQDLQPLIIEIQKALTNK